MLSKPFALDALGAKIRIMMEDEQGDAESRLK
jgi:hypothetical protein